MDLTVSYLAKKTLWLLVGALVYMNHNASTVMNGGRYDNIILDTKTLPQGRSCPCKDARLCDRISTTAAKEIFIFSVKDTYWRHYDWNKVTTVVEFNYHSDELMCYAHSRGVRLVGMADISRSALGNISARVEWVDQQLTKVKENFLDGINVDYEAAIDHNETSLRQDLTSLMTNLTRTIKTSFPHSQITFDFAWSPNCIDKRCYDFKALSDVTDYGFVMSYDERSQTNPPCVAGANAPYNWTRQGLQQFLDLGIPSRKLILGVPWYGYVYTCIRYERHPYGDVCTIQNSTIPGLQCSDAVGRQHDYGDVIERYLSHSTTGRTWDASSKTPYFAFKNSSTGTMYQVWYDDLQSLAIRYNMAVALDLGGVGMWNADSLDYTNMSQIRDMWGLLPNYTLAL